MEAQRPDADAAAAAAASSTIGTIVPNAHEAHVFQLLDDGLGRFLSQTEKSRLIAKVRGWKTRELQKIKAEKLVVEATVDVMIIDGVVRPADRNNRISQIWSVTEFLKQHQVVHENTLRLIVPHAKASCKQLCNAVVSVLPPEMRRRIHHYMIPKQEVNMKKLINYCKEVDDSETPYVDPEFHTNWLGADFAREFTAYCYATMTFVFPEGFTKKQPNQAIRSWLQGVDRHGLRRMDFVRSVRFPLSLAPRSSFFLVSGVIGDILKMKPSISIGLDPSRVFASPPPASTGTIEAMVKRVSSIEKELDTLKDAGHKVRIGKAFWQTTWDYAQLSPNGWKEIEGTGGIPHSDLCDLAGMGRLMADG